MTHEESFQSLFNKMMTETDASSSLDCMISKEPLNQHSAITLNCKHVFNYIPLYKELCRSKIHKKGSIVCPYCRVETSHILPMYIHEEVKVVNGINAPNKSILPNYQCQWVMKTGKNKGEAVCKRGGAIRDGLPHLCTLHFTSHTKLLAKAAQAEAKKAAQAEAKEAKKAAQAEAKKAAQAEAKKAAKKNATIHTKKNLKTNLNGSKK